VKVKLLENTPPFNPFDIVFHFESRDDMVRFLVATNPMIARGHDGIKEARQLVYERDRTTWKDFTE
jgi:hypothetical protein